MVADGYGRLGFVVVASRHNGRLRAGYLPGAGPSCRLEADKTTVAPTIVAGALHRLGAKVSGGLG
jgi:hypothetical protein